jgi:dipeptidyl aminopeptidase/acylaminoacyl peptidase
MKRVAPFGGWESPLAPAQLAAGSLRLGFPSFDRHGRLSYLETRPSEGGRTAVVALDADGEATDLLAAPLSARTKVYEYGGASHAILDDGRLVFVDAGDQQLWIVAPGGEPAPLTREPTMRFGQPTIDRAHGRLVAVGECHAEGHVAHAIVAIDPASGEVRTLVEGRDFYASPTPSEDGRGLAFVAWDHPHMPWDAGEVLIATLDGEGRVERTEHVAGGPENSAMQPVWSPSGELYFLLERDGYWNLHRVRDGAVACVAPRARELGGPPWLLGVRAYAFVDASRVVGFEFDRGEAVLVCFDVRTGEVRELDRSLRHVGQLAVHGARVVAVLGWAGSGSKLVACDVDSGEITILRDAYAGWLEAGDRSEARAITFDTTDGATAHGFYYAPKSARYDAPEGDRPPLVVLVHGGPTGCTSTAESPTIQLFTTRGYGVLDVNYRGSTGYGRAYRDALRGRWGEADVDDVIAGARHLAERGIVDPARIFIRGGSAGGFTVLRSLGRSDVFSAGSCHYGVSDLEALSRDTHKFESHYDRSLIGPYPERRDLFVERSPIHHPERIRRPVIFFQGMDDRVVPPNQTEGLARALRAQGNEVEVHLFEGEGHGFRRAESIVRMLEAELAFFGRIGRKSDSSSAST